MKEYLAEHFKTFKIVKTHSEQIIYFAGVSCVCK